MADQKRKLYELKDGAFDSSEGAWATISRHLQVVADFLDCLEARETTLPTEKTLVCLFEPLYHILYRLRAELLPVRIASWASLSQFGDVAGSLGAFFGKPTTSAGNSFYASICLSTFLAL
jgi:hypothetical protein